MTLSATPVGPSGRPITIFVSYSRDDRKRALPIIAALEKAGFSVWWDGLLQPGERFADTTAAALDSARAVVVLWSRTSVASHWVHDEATRGRDRKCLVPLSLDGSAPPLGFGQYQTFDVSKSRPGDAVMAQVIAAVAALHGADTPEPAAPARTKLDRRLLLAGGGLALLGGGAAIAWKTGLFGGDSLANSVAVMPFSNLTGDPAKAYFSDGVAAEVRAHLARSPRLAVAAQTSSERFRDSDTDAKTIASRLGVAYLLDGSVRAAGSRVRIAAELIDGKSGFNLWAQQFDRPAADVFAVQDEIAAAVTSALVNRVLGGDERTDLRAAGGTDNVTAYDAFLRGSHLYGLGRDEATDKAALAALDAAIAADPAYGLAHAARARVLTVIANLYLTGAARRQAYEAAIAAAGRAVQLSPQCADAHSAQGFAILNGRLDLKGAAAPFERSVVLGKGDANVLARYATYSGRAGRYDAARAACERALQLDPLNPRTAWAKADIALGARRYADVAAPVAQALALNPEIGVARFVLGTARLFLGDVAGAASAYEQETNALFRTTGLAIIRQRQGRMDEARRMLAELVADHGDNGLYQQAQVAAAWGEPDKALDMLEKARVAGDAGLMYAGGDPFLDPLRRIPAFGTLLARLGFDQTVSPEGKT